jgi:hypothetical protein
MNPKAPHMYGTIKLHKEGKPIRPIVNWKNSPGHKLATYLANKLKTHYSYLMSLMYKIQKNSCITLMKLTSKTTLKYVHLTSRTCTRTYHKTN